MSSPGVEPGLRPSQGRVQIPHTPRTFFCSVPCRGIEPRPAVSRTAMRSGTPTGRSFKCLDQDLNLDLDLRRVLCDPLHHRDVFQQHPDPESNQVQGFRKALCDPLHHRDKHQTRADDWICTSIERFTGPPPFLVEPRRQLKQECKDLNPVGRLWRPLPLPGGHSCNRLRSRRTGGIGITTTPSASHSSTLR